MISYLVLLFEWLLGAKKRARAAYSRGYDAMSSRLNATYCGPEAEYDWLTVVTAYNEIRYACKGSKGERASYEEGLRDAITVYERSFGAP